MLFNSYLFILVFLPLSVFLYFMFNKYAGLKAGNIVLTLSSIVFYSFAGMKCLIILLCSVLVNYFSAQLLKKYKKNKGLFVVAVSVNILLLLYFKYCNFFISNINAVLHCNIGLQNIILPLGISFFTFQQISYLVCTYKGEIMEHSFGEYAAYILYFPKLIMGPLIEPNDFLKQLQDKNLRKFDSEHTLIGIQMFTLGLFKKVLIADTFAKVVNWGFNNFPESSSIDWIIIIVSYSFQIYFDFSGYSDMAIAISRMFNLELPINFDSPYKSYSLNEFWRKWHISLTQFLKKYIYIPLGGNRKGLIHTYFNVMIVFLISGFWHGPNWTFILWGFLHGLICILERIFEKNIKKIHSGFRWLFTFGITSHLWMLFRSESVGQWLKILKKAICVKSCGINPSIANFFELPELVYLSKMFHIDQIFSGTLLFIVGSFSLVLICENNCKRHYKICFRTVITTVLLFAWSVISMSGDSNFIYSGF